MAAARVRGDEFPATRGERAFVALCIALPCTLVPGALTFYVLGAVAALIVSGAFGGTLVVYISRLLSAPRLEAPPVVPVVPVVEKRCRVCGAPFTPHRANHVYCSRACRDEAAAWRRHARRQAARVEDQGPPPVRKATPTQMEAAPAAPLVSPRRAMQASADVDARARAILR